MITSKILSNSISPAGVRLVTFEWTYPRFIHAEVLTHRVFSRNSASSRAIPTRKFRERVLENPAIPCHWGANQKGMSADDEVANTEQCEAWWLYSRHEAIDAHAFGESLGLHKQVVNRVLEPWMNITTIVSATEWANFFHLRRAKGAEPNIRRLADLAWEQFHEYLPAFVPVGGWHLPLVDHEERERFGIVELKKISAGRCARVSYLTHDGIRDPHEDIRLHDRLVAEGHWSPLEHQALSSGVGAKTANFGPGWMQYRYEFPQETGPVVWDKRCKRCGCWEKHVKGCPNG